jgi:hypothetical protein
LRIIGDLGPYLAEATEETLALVLETIRAVIGVDGTILDASSTQQLVDAILHVWTTNARGKPSAIDLVLLTVTDATPSIIHSRPGVDRYY